MKTCDQQYLVVDYFFNELTQAHKKQFEQHLTECQDCSNNLEALQVTAPLIKNQKREYPEKESLQQYHQQLKTKYYAPERLSIRIKKLGAKFISKPSIPWRLAEAAALILIGIIIGRMTIWKSQPSPDQLAANGYISIESSVSDVLLKNYLQETEMILLDVKNLNPIEDEQILINLKQLAKFRSLLQKTILCRSQAQEFNDDELVKLINEIELILLELCNVEKETLAETLLEIRQQMEDSNLLFNIKTMGQGSI